MSDETNMEAAVNNEPTTTEPTDEVTPTTTETTDEVPPTTTAPAAAETDTTSSAEPASPTAEAGSVSTPTSVSQLMPGMEVRGTVKRIELYGAFVDIGVGQDGLLHISQLGRSNVRNVEDVVKVGQNIPVFVLRVESDTRRIALSLVKPPATPWEALHKGMIVTGRVVRLEQFGVFVDIGAERPGMIHVSELASGYVSTPSDVVKVGDEVRAQIIDINRKKRRIDMSLKVLEEKIEIPVEPDDERVPTAMELALRRAMEGDKDEDTSRYSDKQRAKQEKRQREMEDAISRTLRSQQR